MTWSPLRHPLARGHIGSTWYKTGNLAPSSNPQNLRVSHPVYTATTSLSSQSRCSPTRNTPAISNAALLTCSTCRTCSGRLPTASIDLSNAFVQTSQGADRVRVRYIYFLALHDISSRLTALVRVASRRPPKGQVGTTA